MTLPSSGWAARDPLPALAGPLTALLLALGPSSCSGPPPIDAGADGGRSASSSDGGAEAPADGTAVCAVVVASDYDQSCATDSDCVVVEDVPSCPPPACVACDVDAINKGAETAYDTALAASLASITQASACGCPCRGQAICRNGLCQADFCSPPSADTLPACASAGGYCMYAAGTTCNVGPAGACAYPDEVCCLN